MAKSKVYKIIGGAFVLACMAAAIGYSTLSNRHKAIVKTEFLHRTGLVDNQWKIGDDRKTFKMLSPTLLIDGIYKSMEGPKASNYVQLSPDSSLIWITGFEVKAVDAKTRERLSDDFICHTNIDFNDAKYFGGFGLSDRIGKHYPRMTSLSHGIENFHLPKGYGIPMRGNDLLMVTTESLNHNLKDEHRWIKHEVAIDYGQHDGQLKPLMSRTIFIMLPFDQKNPYKEPLDPAANSCIPVETKNHTYDNGHGEKLSGHWVIPVGKKSYRSEVNSQLQLKDSLRLHAAAIHVHPFATSIALVDKTERQTIFTSRMINHKNRIGLEKVEDFVSEKGIWLYGDHEYELVLTVDNTSDIAQDMMGSAFLFFYDRELEQKIRTGKK
ncbi:hypothetical protein [Flavobacterium selenitireducens]|uniref:hypothetical protein n=1 Tax=Flavobacterium selenitireducens TaxID=2722704 RepID=UPI00168B1A51|nr:hypothetical protein [Flavobacterium selenitireducens]MBD3582711.1 hypothetical protein [Flavobacterium selenitireducens]